MFNFFLAFFLALFYLFNSSKTKKRTPPPKRRRGAPSTKLLTPDAAARAAALGKTAHEVRRQETNARWRAENPPVSRAWGRKETQKEAKAREKVYREAEKKAAKDAAEAEKTQDEAEKKKAAEKAEKAWSAIRTGEWRGAKNHGDFEDLFEAAVRQKLARLGAKPLSVQREPDLTRHAADLPVCCDFQFCTENKRVGGGVREHKHYCPDMLVVAQWGGGEQTVFVCELKTARAAGGKKISKGVSRDTNNTREQEVLVRYTNLGYLLARERGHREVHILTGVGWEDEHSHRFVDVQVRRLPA